VGGALRAGGARLIAPPAPGAAGPRLAPQSLGGSFLAFSERHGIDVRKLIESEHAMSRDYAQLDPLRRWLSDRLTVLHDLWHVLAGYDATTAGESALMAFSLPQRANDRALPIFITMSVLSGKLGAGEAAVAFRRGKRAVYLVEQCFEDLLPLPLDEVRARLQIDPPHAAHRNAKSEGLLIPESA
jgi:ubiquinone biosynthesis protein COQ4